MAFFQPVGARILYPGQPMHVLHPRAAAAAAGDWWDPLSASLAVVAAYRAVGAASYAASKVNLANPGTYDLTVSRTDPDWTSAGWDFDSSADARLDTGIVPNTVKAYSGNYLPWSVVARFSDLDTADDRQTLVHAGDRGDTVSMGIWPIYTASGTTMRLFNHALQDYNWSPSALPTAGVYAYLGKNLRFYDAGGHQDLGTLGANASGSIAEQWCIGDDNASTFPGSMKIQAVAIYTEEISAANAQAIMEAMYALT